MHLIDEICFGDKYEGLYELIEKTHFSLDQGEGVINSLLRFIGGDYIDPISAYEDDEYLSEEEKDALFKEIASAERSEENIEKYKQYHSNDIFRRINAAYTHASISINLMQEIAAKLNMQLKVEEDIKENPRILW